MGTLLSNHALIQIREHIVPPPGAGLAPGPFQGFPLPGSTDSEEFYYDCFLDVQQGNFAAAQVFFIANSHTIIANSHVDIAEFQASCPYATLCPLEALPDPVFVRGHEILNKNGTGIRSYHHWGYGGHILLIIELSCQLLCWYSFGCIFICLIAALFNKMGLRRLLVLLIGGHALLVVLIRRALTK
jgi:hypothetical protein